MADADIVELYRAGHLAAASILCASLAQIERLRQLHNASSAKPIVSVHAAVGQ